MVKNINWANMQEKVRKLFVLFIIAIISVLITTSPISASIEGSGEVSIPSEESSPSKESDDDNDNNEDEEETEVEKEEKVDVEEDGEENKEGESDENDTEESIEELEEDTEQEEYLEETVVDEENDEEIILEENVENIVEEEKNDDEEKEFIEEQIIEKPINLTSEINESEELVLNSSIIHENDTIEIETLNITKLNESIITGLNESINLTTELNISINNSDINVTPVNLTFINTTNITGDFVWTKTINNTYANESEEFIIKLKLPGEVKPIVQNIEKSKIKEELVHLKEQLKEETDNLYEEAILQPEVDAVKEIKFNNLTIENETISLGIEDLDKPEYVQSFAIDPEQLNFTDAIVTVVAQGTELYKCQEWNFSTQECYGEWKLFKTGLIPGQEYTFILTPDDPGFGESINITAAEHLDVNRTVISDIYNKVQEQDNVWSEPIYHDEFVRATFEQNLTNGNVINLYVRNNQSLNTTIGIYEKDSEILLVSTPVITTTKQYDVELVGMNGSNNIFDLRIVNLEDNLLAYIEFDYVHDGPNTPSVGTVSYPNNVILNSGTTKTITCNATITDPNGFANISNVNATFYDPAQANHSSGDDNNNHYTDSSCSLSGGSGNTINAECGFDIQYYANPSSDWECNITATDGSESASNSSGQNIDIAELKSISTSNLAYHNGTGGSIDLGATSGELSMNITNLGNVNVTIQVNGSDNAFVCDIGTIELSKERYNTSSGFSYNNGINLTSNPTNISNYEIPQRIDDGSSSVGYVYWLLQIPLGGVGGNCTGSISVNTV